MMQSNAMVVNAPSSDLVRALGLPDGSDWGAVELEAMQAAASLEDVRRAFGCDICTEVSAMVDVTRHMGCNMGTNSDYVAVQVAHGEAILDELCQILGVSSHAEIVHAVRLLVAGDTR